MSTSSRPANSAPPPPPQPAIWPLINCSVCYLPFFNDSTGAPSMPFWLTECGHVICNAHLNADQSCSCCHAPDVHPVPLQPQPDPLSMGQWHLFLPNALSQLASTAQYQHEAASSLIAHFRQKCERQSAVLDRVSTELKTLKRQTESLQQENAQLRGQMGYDSGGNDVYSGGQGIVDAPLNGNGKRPYPGPTEAYSRPRTARPPTSLAHPGSSPRSLITPNLPPRMTLPIGEQGAGAGVRALDMSENLVPHLEKFAYVPPETPTAFSAPVQHHHQHHRQYQHQQPQPHQQRHQFARPGPQAVRPQPRMDDQASDRVQRVVSVATGVGAMGPPPLPASRRAGDVREVPPSRSSANARPNQTAPPSRAAFRALQPAPRMHAPTPLPNAHSNQYQSQPPFNSNPNHQPFYPITNLPPRGVPQTPSAGAQRFVPVQSNGAKGGERERTKRFVPAARGVSHPSQG